MPVTIRPWQKASRHVSRTVEFDYSKKDIRWLFAEMCEKEDQQVKCIIKSSFDDLSPDANIGGSPNGFVIGILKAYNEHHHIILRPDDVWMAILTQLSFFIHRHAEALRSVLVDHEGKKDVDFISSRVLRDTDIGAMARSFAEAMGKSLRDDLYSWIIPDFTTTTNADVVAASIAMAGAFRRYFNHRFMYICGIPSITLLGTRDDWIKLCERASRIPALTDGLRAETSSQPYEELACFYRLLKPVLSYMARTFEDPTDSSILDFWTHIAHESGGSNTHYISGWLTTFCFWDSQGSSLYRTPQGEVDVISSEGNRPGYNLDGILYHRVPTDKIPLGWVGAPVKVDDNGVIFDTMMVAGSMGLRVSSSGEILESTLFKKCDPVKADGSREVQSRAKGESSSQEPHVAEAEAEETGMDTLQPVIGWWMYEVEAIKDEGLEFWDEGNDTEDGPRLLGLAARLAAS